ncbi:hypothetical protein JR316_0008399 [Psilocybe cubensis]|uniref:Uncharacterized protein n=4 Tax=Psilocybe cubensis TaxID=181762 RepID=A0A8H7XWJ4_PSICU|nr:hypothetical protein JR316_0008393 [Psilocybe cubensis]XP_047747425.1 hypothetical protein JR316_0008395 [Psilocybe cubensis]XP_047747429.1 hypothetical protein JR316_0008399 [Psilocybe cubensis]KAH9479798.1 hypothetical protein JR316_0008393 [Psilocybe cubensis]KAH9479800.1 hypothetical protein JR316_0008395 [Psilocybe cubensis]KAH9479804.1 hypothetical protein JR316_0008399 [Psilocybe cubensis]
MAAPCKPSDRRTGTCISDSWVAKGVLGPAATRRYGRAVEVAGLDIQWSRTHTAMGWVQESWWPTSMRIRL